jgi:putative transposase
LKVRIYPQPELHEIWPRWKAAVRFVYNKAIEVLKAGFSGGSYQLEAGLLNDPTLPQWVKDAPRHPKANAVQDAYDAWKLAKANGGEVISCPLASIVIFVGAGSETVYKEK